MPITRRQFISGAGVATAGLIVPGFAERALADRKSGVEGKRVDPGGRRTIKKKKKNTSECQSPVQCSSQPSHYHETKHML